MTLTTWLSLVIALFLCALAAAVRKNYTAFSLIIFADFIVLLVVFRMVFL